MVPLLQNTPGLRPIAIFDEVRRRHPELGAGIRRTLEGRIRTWRALNGTEQDVIFRQEHPPGRLGLSDFTDMRERGISIAGEPLDQKSRNNRSEKGTQCASASPPITVASHKAGTGRPATGGGP